MARLIVRGFSRAGYYYLPFPFSSCAVVSSLYFSLAISFSLPSPPSFSFSLSLRHSFPSPTCRPRFHDPRLGTPRSRTFRSRNNSGTPGFLSSRLLPLSSNQPPPRFARAFVIMRGEPCISHRGVIRECFPRRPSSLFSPHLLSPPCSFTPSLSFSLFLAPPLSRFLF